MDPIWADLINSDWHDHLESGRREDRIGNDAWLGPFLARTGWTGDRLPGRAERDRLRRLRRSLRGMVDAIREGRRAAKADLAALNSALAAAHLVKRLEQRVGTWQAHLESKAVGIAKVESEVAVSFASVLSDGDPTRIKVCGNPDCGWVMYDESRSRTRQWCDAKECGNLIKVRRFRQRQRAGLAKAKRTRTSSG
jgi:predicted RNA-binding Zn ribbon-like protein